LGISSYSKSFYLQKGAVPVAQYNSFQITRGDIDAMLGNFVDNLSVFLVAISLNLFVVGMPPEIVFGRMVPGMAIGLLLANIHLRWLAVRVARQTGRSDITALPFGVSIVFVIIYTFGIILPVKLATNDPEAAWRVAVVATVIGGVIEIIGAFIGPAMQKFLPRAVMLGALAGIGIVFIAGLSMDDIFGNPYIGFPAMAIILWAYVGRGKLPLRLPAGLVALIIGAILALALGQSRIDFSGAGFQLPQPWLLFLGGAPWAEAFTFLGIIIPIAIIDFVVTMDNVESANSVKDPYPVLEPMLLDGAYTIAGALFGSPYPNTTFIGHPAYKRMGAKVNYGFMAAIIMFLLALFGLFSGISILIPLAAVAPILLFIGLTMTDVAFQEVPRKHYIAVAAAIVPAVVELGKEHVDLVTGALGAPPAVALQGEQLQAFINAGVNVPGYIPLSYGTIVISMILAALVAFMVSREFMKAALVGVVAAILAFFGIIHTPQMGVAAAFDLSIMWLALAIGFVIVHQFRDKVVEQDQEPETTPISDLSTPSGPVLATEGK
jgi:AGZA family xanthine/uracil permease-like MFS transporter